MSVEERLRELGIELPEPPPPVGNYIGAVTVGNLVFLSGHGPRSASGEYSSGKVGGELTPEQGQEEARQVGLDMLATLRAEIGDLDRVRRVVKVLGMVNAAPDFRNHPKVIDGFSDLMVEVFGEKGRGARSAVGMGSLPFQIPVEVEMIVEID
ncbi:MAG: RidA family protein [Proteobacteria bacterium]|nr:RidA family protein [Pseudomonadota bacterium]